MKRTILGALLALMTLVGALGVTQTPASATANPPINTWVTKTYHFTYGDCKVQMLQGNYFGTPNSQVKVDKTISENCNALEYPNCNAAGTYGCELSVVATCNGSQGLYDRWANGHFPGNGATGTFFPANYNVLATCTNGDSLIATRHIWVQPGSPGDPWIHTSGGGAPGNGHCLCAWVIATYNAV